MKYMVILLLLLSLFFYNELDLPILPPNDQRREVVVQPAELPSPAPTTSLPEEPAPPPVFFSETIPATESIVYVLDYSQSMSGIQERVDYRTVRNRWEVVQLEAIRSISRLAGSFKFNIVVFGTNGGCGVAQWQKDMQQASEATKAAAANWINSFENVGYYGGATPTAPAVMLAFNMKPESIVLLTDGYPSECGIEPGVVPWVSHRNRIASENKEGIPIQVFGIGISISYAREFCLGVASDSSGSFTEIKKQ